MKLFRIFWNPDLTTEEIEHALEAMELIAPLSENDIAMKSHDLFHVAMRTPLSGAYTREKKWEASRLAMRGADKRYALRRVEDPKDILAFLSHHFDLATQQDCGYDESTQNALCALAYTFDPDTIEALKDFDPTKPSFCRGICYFFEDGQPVQLRKAALLFLSIIADRWFNASDPIMGPDQMRKLCVDWASAVDVIEHTHDVQEAIIVVLLGMINSSHWRPHIVTEKWKLLEYFASIPDDSQPLKRCLDNPELTDAISTVDNPVAMFLWLEILCLKYNELVPEVREQLGAVTQEVAMGTRRMDLDMYMSVMDSKLEQAEGSLAGHNTESADPAAVALRVEIHNLHQARAAWLALKEVNAISV